MKFLTTTAVATFVFGGFAFSAPPADDLLAGPSIEAEEVTSQDMTDRVLKEQSKSKKVGSRQQSQMWRTALKAIDLTKEQEMEIHKIMEEFQKLSQIFRSTHGKEIRSIRDEYGNKKRDVLTTILTGAPKDQALIPEASQKRMLELMELAPDAKVYQEKAWVLLTAQQQKTFQINYQNLLDEEAKRSLEKKKNKSQLEAKDKDSRVLSPKDPKFNNRENNPEGDRIDRRGDSIDDASMRRIKFLRRLQQLENES